VIRERRGKTGFGRHHDLFRKCRNRVLESRKSLPIAGDHVKPKSTLSIPYGSSCGLILAKFLILSKVSGARHRGATTESMTNTSQGGAIEGNAADDTLMVDQILFP